MQGLSYKNVPSVTPSRGTRTVARKSSIGGFTFLLGSSRSYMGAWHSNLTKILLIHSVSYFNLGDLKLCLGGLSLPKPPRGDGAASYPWDRQSCFENAAWICPTVQLGQSLPKKVNQNHRAAVFARLTKDRVGALGRGVFSINSQESPHSCPQVEPPCCARYASGQANGAAQIASTLGDWKATRKRKSCHKLFTGKRNASL